MKKISDIHEIQEIELNILKYVHTLCESNNMDYLLCAGTLIGAVRHQGFIPWDDDIDIMMPRDDYEKLIQIINSEHDSIFKAVTYKNCPALGTICAKILDTRTSVYEKDVFKVDGLGINIDIFPIDGIPPSTAETDRILAKISWWRRSVSRIQVRPSRSRPGESLPLWRVPFVFFLIMLIDTSAKRCQFHNSDKAAVVVAGKHSEIMKREDFENKMLIKFETEEFYIPCCYHEFLTKQYGNYMRLPPISQRRMKHKPIAYWK